MKAVSSVYHPAANDMAQRQTRLDAPRPTLVSNRHNAAADGASHEPLPIPSSYAVERPAGELSPVTRQPNVYRDAGGSQYVHDGASWYPARDDADNGTLRVWQPDRAHKPQYPVRYDADGSFKLHNNVGLKGGVRFGSESANSFRSGGTATPPIVRRSAPNSTPCRVPLTRGTTRTVSKW